MFPAAIQIADTFHFGIVPLIVLAVCCALHAVDYIKENRKTFWCLFITLISSIIGVAVVGFKSPLLFLILWEIMGVSSFALVAFETDKKETKRAAWYYIMSAVAGALVLMLMFSLLDSPYKSDYKDLIVILAIIGFGLKSGLAFIHFWLPSAHAAAPAPVSALMSGAMNNMGILGILVVMSGFCDKYTYVYSSSLVGWIVFILGVAGSLGAIILALAQNHLKRLIAYSSVENFGIMVLAMGLAILGNVYQCQTVERYASYAILFHMFNHAVFKGLLFISAGAVHIGAKTYDMNKLGGLIKKMPFVGRSFIYGSMGISGIPPFASFWSELLIYASAIFGLFSKSTPLIIASVIVIITLALVGGIATAAFTKVAGTVFLGEPRSDYASNATDVPLCTKIAIGILVFISIGIVAAHLLWALLFHWGSIDSNIFYLPVIFVLLVALFFLISKCGSTKKYNRTGPTWDCGYAAPTARMQYTGNSFSLPLEKFFAPILKTKANFTKPAGLFPTPTKRAFHTEDFSIRTLWAPLFKFIAFIAEKVHRLQSGHLHLYILFMVVAISAMLVWAFIVK